MTKQHFLASVYVSAALPPGLSILSAGCLLHYSPSRLYYGPLVGELSDRQHSPHHTPRHHRHHNAREEEGQPTHASCQCLTTACFRGSSPRPAPSARGRPPPTSTTGPWPATPAGPSSGAASGSPTAAWRGRGTVTSTGPAGDPASGAGLTSESLCSTVLYCTVLYGTVGQVILKREKGTLFFH